MFTNIPGPGIRTAIFAAFGSWSGCAHKERRKPSGQRCAYARRCPEGVAAPLGCVIFPFLSKLRLVHTRLSEKNRTQGHTRRNRWRFGWGRYHYPRHELHVHEHPRAGCQNGKLCRFWVLVGGALSKNAESLRNSDALMRVAVPRRRGPAGLRNLFSFLSKLRFSHSVLRAFRVCET